MATIDPDRTGGEGAHLPSWAIGVGDPEETETMVGTVNNEANVSTQSKVYQASKKLAKYMTEDCVINIDSIAQISIMIPGSKYIISIDSVIL